MSIIEGMHRQKFKFQTKKNNLTCIKEKENRERLLRNVKKECKQLMEVAVTRKFIHEDNSCITSLCGN